MNSTAQDEITAYVYAVRAALGDLPEAQRDELLEDLIEHLTEVMAADGEGSLTDRVGSPEAYAAELLGTAPYVGGFPDPPARPSPLTRAGEWAAPRLRHADTRLGPVLGYERASDFGRLLRPAWWVLRGYLLAMVAAALFDNGDQPIGLLPRVGGSDAVALILLAAGVIASIWFGRRSWKLTFWSRYALYAGTTVLVVAGLAGFTSADSTTRDSYFSNVTYNDPYNGVQDIFVYDESGRLINGARLLDQNGQPIQVGSPYCYDEQTGIESTGELGVYPYCPSDAPFRLTEASASPAPSMSPAPSTSPNPSPSASPSPS
ncbi:HAAS signaling domain-containing protein [Actinoplanes sp. NPDC051494]|uniref:HAAS signaling domain-containing protein n=1 Tax=Actinoplanes sp. NPDC051494 TaxID=3363907 RepID=UPI0037B714A2